MLHYDLVTHEPYCSRMPACLARLRPAAVLLLLLLIVPATARAQEGPDLHRFVHWAYHDAVGAVNVLQPQTPLYVLGAAAVLAPLSQIDETVTLQAHSEYQTNPRLAGYLNVVNELGGSNTYVPAAGIFAATLLTKNTRLQDAAFTSLQSLVYAHHIAQAIKQVVGRARPYQASGAHAFDPFSGNSSFPSGHSMKAFALITPWVLYYPHPVTYSLFALSAGTAFARLSLNMHWTTDVVAGSALGIATAYWLTRRHQGSTSRIRLEPSAGPESLSLTLRMAL